MLPAAAQAVKGPRRRRGRGPSTGRSGLAVDVGSLPPPPAPTQEDPLPARLVVLASGEGRTLQALLDAAADPAYGAEVVAVGTDRDGARALDRALAAGVEAFTVRLADHPDRASWDRALADELLRHEPDLVVCAGFMRILGAAVLEHFASRVVNTHPALLPSFPGAHAVPDALAYGVKITGVTVHLVDEGVDTGPVVAQAAVPVEPGDTVESLHARIQHVEQPLYVDAVGRLARGGWTVEGRTVHL
jgi:formyltetrahydrofolate-dependent phosphoribosylglycinamide formyltransferase